MNQKVTVTDGSLRVYREPSLDSSVIVTVAKGATLQLGDAAVHEEREWLKAMLADGSIGYVLGPAARSHTTLGGNIPLEEALKEVEQPSPTARKSAGRDRMIIGGLLCAMGIMVMAAARSITGPVAPYAWGAILAGAYMFADGLFRRMQK
jgi:hypothetical protein